MPVGAASAAMAVMGATTGTTGGDEPVEQVSFEDIET
jgi:hypothetical protein